MVVVGLMVPILLDIRGFPSNSNLFKKISKTNQNEEKFYTLNLQLELSK